MLYSTAMFPAQVRERIDIVRGDMPLIGARVHGDALRAGGMMAVSAALRTDGSAPPRELRSTAILLTLTLSAVTTSFRLCWRSRRLCGFWPAPVHALAAVHPD